MTARDELERRLCQFLEGLGKELPGGNDPASPYELRVFSALLNSLERDLRALWEGPQTPGRQKRSGDDDESDWRKAATLDIRNKTTFVHAIAWLDVFFQKYGTLAKNNILPLSQLQGQVSMALEELNIPEELWARIRKREKNLAADQAWEILLEGHDEEKY